MSADTPRHARSSSLPVSGATLVALAALVVLLVLGLIWLVGPDGQADAFAWLGSIAALVASAFGIVGAAQNRQLAAGVQRVAHQTNGALDARIEAAITRALIAAGAAPEVPTQRTGAHDDATHPANLTGI